MKKQSAGILLYRFKERKLEVLLAHPGGPFWAKKDAGVWSIPKGEYTNEEPLHAALREFAEETGVELDGEFIALAPAKQKSGKVVQAFAQERDLEAAALASNTFQMEWPPRSGKMQEFPEVDRTEWFNLETALAKIIPGQAGILVELAKSINCMK